ncbi:hypothetical protein FOMPIDRAFT_1054142 [Fomitopsis schrenkii]|uniref:F-box domain-containing protein n=1 Tax=Fomitopsis schrenkii TaxID=2126942 RepID=S8DQD0_FOMSC|nr:hypothetical protein FOMPIDRAFT_1054142 [Fomitopsis schrenkii]
MSSVSHREVPLELIEHIIDFNFDDKATLVACSKVARAWVQATRHHLFAKIRINTTRRILALDAILPASPYIARSVKEAQTPAWLSEHKPRDALLRIFKQLKAVKSLVCAGQTLQPTWNEVLGHLPSVKSLKLRVGWTDLYALNSLLSSVPEITDLFIETRMLSGVGDVDAPSARIVAPLSRLERMAVFNGNGLPNDFQSILLKEDLPRLESVEAQLGSDDDAVYLCEFLDRCGSKTMKDLHVRFTYGYPEGTPHGAWSIV